MRGPGRPDAPSSRPSCARGVRRGAGRCPTGLPEQVKDDRKAVISTIVEIQNLTQLSRLLERLEGVRDVQMVARDTG